MLMAAAATSATSQVGPHHPRALAVGRRGPRPANELARRIATVKGNSGGRLYINEACEMFAPLGAVEGGVGYIYLGPLAGQRMVDAPDVDRGDD